MGAGQRRESAHTRRGRGAGLGSRPRTSGLWLLLPLLLPCLLPSFLPSPPPFTFPKARGDGGRWVGRGLSGRLLLVGRRGSGSQPPGCAAPGDPGVRASGRLAPGGGTAPSSALGHPTRPRRPRRFSQTTRRAPAAAAESAVPGRSLGHLRTDGAGGADRPWGPGPGQQWRASGSPGPEKWAAGRRGP